MAEANEQMGASASTLASGADASADIADFDSAADIEQVMEVRHPKTNETLRFADGRPFTITLLGRDNEVFQTLARKQNDRRMASNMRTRSPILTAVIEKDDIELLVAVTRKWDLVLDGKIPESKPENYRVAYSHPKRRWLKEQIDEFVGVRANFIKD